MKSTKFITLGALAAIALAPATMKAQDDINYMRSSIYTILVKSDAQNERIEKETNETADNEFMALAKSFANTDEKKAANDTVYGNVPLTRIPQVGFVNIAIPNQFNDHNLGLRVLDFDPIRANITDDEKNAANPKTKNQKFGGFAKNMAGMALGAASGKESSTMVRTDEVDEYLPAVLQRYFRENHTADSLVARWFKPDWGSEWSFGLVHERGLQNASAEEIARANANSNLKSMLMGKGFDLINNTYVVAVNLRFRSNKAVVAESQALAEGIFGDAAKLAGAAAQAAAGDGFQVQAVTHLYKLDWDEQISNTLGSMIVGDNGCNQSLTLQDLIDSGACHLSFVGKEKAGANVRQSIFSDKPMSDLIMRATTRSIDAAIAKLQEKNEVFRTAVPVYKSEDGFVYAKIGLKEGLKKGDEYELLEANEDENGRIVYKSIGKATAVEGQIWNNLYGAQDEVAENAKDNKSDKSLDEAVSLGMSQFKCGKKGDYAGYYLRLKKKK